MNTNSKGDEMQVQAVNNRQNNQLTFGEILKTSYLGDFGKLPSKPERQLIDAFKENKIIQNYCTKNDVFVDFATYPVVVDYGTGILGERVEPYSMVRIRKPFKKITGNIFQRIKNYLEYKFKYNSNEGVYIYAAPDKYASPMSYSSLGKVHRKIVDIKDEQQLLKYYQTQKPEFLDCLYYF